MREKKVKKGEPDHLVHKYFRTEFKSSGTMIFRCGLLNCPHFVYEPLIVGRLSICWRCGVQYVIVPKTLSAKKMHCEDCTRLRYNKPKPPKQEDLRKEITIDSLLSLIPDIPEIREREEDDE